MHAEQESFSHPGGDTLAALVSVFGRQVARELIPVEVESHMTLRAYLAPPTRTRPNRTQQFLFVNGRPISSRTLSHAVDEAYSGVLSHGRFPIVVLLLDVPPDMVDVNVHPRKAEVKFVREHDAHSLVFHSLRDALVGKGLVPSARLEGAPAFAAIPAFSLDPPARWLSAHEGHGIAPRPFRLTPTPYAPAPGAPTPESSHIADQRLDPSQIRVLGQIANTYIVLETAEGMAIIDQHVAHERVLYERFRRRASENPVQMLAVPVTLEISKREAAIVMERLKEFSELGYALEEFGPDAVLLRGVPAELKLADVEQTLRDMLEDVVELTVERKILAPRKPWGQATACKSAEGRRQDVRAGDHGASSSCCSAKNPYVCTTGADHVKLDHTSLSRSSSAETAA